MAVYSCKQSDGNSCGAACTMVAIAEIRNNQHLMNAGLEREIWYRIRRDTPPYYSMPHGIKKYITETWKQPVTVLEHTETIEACLAGVAHPDIRTALEGFRAEYDQGMDVVGGGIIDTPLSMHHFMQQNARIMLACVRRVGALHWLLGRTDPGPQINVMDPGIDPNGSNNEYNIANLLTPNFDNNGHDLTFTGIAIIIR